MRTSNLLPPTIKSQVATYLRGLYLLPIADHLMFQLDVLKNRKANRAFLRSHPNFVPPPALNAYDAYNHTNYQSYYEKGKRNAGLISELIAQYVSGSSIRICEWGCGPARVIQHLTQPITGFSDVELFGTDYNASSIQWCKENFKNIHFSRNDLEPPLPMESELFDCLYAISIFTHLSEPMHHAWVKELFRVLKPGGILIFTTHGDATANRLSTAEKSRYASGMLVVKSKVKEGSKHFLAYHPRPFVRDVLLKDVTVLKHIPDASAYNMEQEVWVVRKSQRDSG